MSITTDEYLDLVDENDNVIGSKKRQEVYQEGLSNFRVINVFIKNSKDELWIPRRTKEKRIFPLSLDMSVGGHVESGETYEDAFSRETKEELNIDINKTTYRYLGSLTPNDGVSAFMKVYEIEMDNVPDYNKNDFIEYFWLKPADVIKKILDGENAKGDLIKLVKHFYPQK